MKTFDWSERGFILCAICSIWTMLSRLVRSASFVLFCFYYYYKTFLNISIWYVVVFRNRILCIKKIRTKSMRQLRNVLFNGIIRNGKERGGGGVNPQIMSFLFEFLFFLNDFCLGSKWYAAIDTWIFGYHYKWKIIKKHKFQIRLVWVMRNLDGLIGSCDLKNEKKNGWKFHHGISLAVSA